MSQWSQSSVINKAENSARGMCRSIVDPQIGSSAPYYCLSSYELFQKDSVSTTRRHEKGLEK